MSFVTTILQNAKEDFSRRAQSLARSVNLPSLDRRHLFVIPLTNV